MTKSAVIEYALTLQVDNELLANHNDAMTTLVHPMVGQLAMMALENKTLRAGLSLKEERRITPRGWLFPCGRGQNATSDAFMNEQALVESEAAQKQADLTMRWAETAAQKKFWEEQKVEYQKQRKRLAAAGLPMTQAGPLPLLKNVILGISTVQSDGLSISTGTMPNSQKGKGKQCNISVESLWEYDLDPEAVESDTESDPWSVQDDSDE
jgi:hypothetical protein